MVRQLRQSPELVWQNPSSKMGDKVEGLTHRELHSGIELGVIMWGRAPSTRGVHSLGNPVFRVRWEGAGQEGQEVQGQIPGPVQPRLTVEDQEKGLEPSRTSPFLPRPCPLLSQAPHVPAAPWTCCLLPAAGSFFGPFPFSSPMFSLCLGAHSHTNSSRELPAHFLTRKKQILASSPPSPGWAGASGLWEDACDSRTCPEVN